MIPQDAVIFTGSLRENVDPAAAHADADVAAALAAVRLDELLAPRRDDADRSPAPTRARLLELRVTELGGNISSGQAQLIYPRSTDPQIAESTGASSSSTFTTDHAASLYRNQFFES